MKDYDEKLFGENDDEILDGEIADQVDDTIDDLDFEGFDDDLDGADDFSQNDDRIDRVLDEIAELKRNMTSGTGSGQSYSAPYRNSGANTPSEVALYNEISRLRDELNKTQHSQSMHMELNRMKEEMERETKSNEEKLLTEIKNLQKQIKSLRGDEESAETEEPPRASADADITDLIKINESLVSYTRAFGNKLEADIEKLKESIPSLPALEEISAKLTAIKEMPMRVSSVVTEKRKLAAGAETAAVTDITEIVRRLIEIKLQLGKLNKDEYERELKTLALYDSLTVAKSAIYSSTIGVAEKLDALRRLENELAISDDCYVYDIVVKYNELVDHLLAQQITLDGVEVFSRLTPGGKITSSLTGETRAIATRFVGLVGEIGDRATGGTIDKLPEIVGLKNKLQGNRYVAENDALYDEVLTLNSDLVFINDAAAAEKCAADIKEKIAHVCRLPYSEFVSYPHLEYDKRPTTVGARGAAQEFVDEMLEGEEIKTSDEAVNALTSAVNLLRAEIADGALLSGASPADSQSLSELLADVAHIKTAIDSLVGEDVDALVETENEDISKLLEEVKTLHTEVNTLSESSPAGAGGGASTPDEVNLFLSEIVSLRDEVQAYKDEISGVIERLGDRAAGGESFVPTSENADNTGAMILDELTGIRADLAGYTDELEAVKAAVEEIRTGDNLRAVVSDEGTVIAAPAAVDNTPVIAELDEIKKLLTESPLAGDNDKLLSVRDELLAAVGKINTAAVSDDKFGDIKAEIESVKEQLSDLQLYETVGGAQTADNAAVLEEIASLRDMLAEVSAAGQTVDLAPLEEGIDAVKVALDDFVPADTAAIKEEISALRAELDFAPANELGELKREISELKAAIHGRAGDKDSVAIRDIRESVHKMIDEPDYSVMNEILALREEFQLMKEKIEKGVSARGYGAAEEISALKAEIERQRETQDTLLALVRNLLENQERLDATVNGRLVEFTEEKRERDEAIAHELENVKYSLGVLQGSEDKDADADLELSIGKLKAELSQMAGIVEEDRQTARKKTVKKPDNPDEQN